MWYSRMGERVEQRNPPGSVISIPRSTTLPSMLGVKPMRDQYGDWDTMGAVEWDMYAVAVDRLLKGLSTSIRSAVVTCSRGRSRMGYHMPVHTELSELGYSRGIRFPPSMKPHDYPQIEKVYVRSIVLYCTVPYSKLSYKLSERGRDDYS